MTYTSKWSLYGQQNKSKNKSKGTSYKATEAVQAKSDSGFYENGSNEIKWNIYYILNIRLKEFTGRKKAKSRMTILWIDGGWNEKTKKQVCVWGKIGSSVLDTLDLRCLREIQMEISK